MQSISTSGESNIETIWQIWLSNIIDPSEINAGTKEQIRSTINRIEMYRDCNECEQFIRSLPSNDRAVFLVDDHFAEQIIPQIHDLQQIFAIYVCTSDKQRDESRFEQFSKFRGKRAYMRRQMNLNRRRDNRRRRREETDEQFSFNIFNNDINKDKSTGELDGEFIHSQLIIDCLQRMKSNPKEIEQFVSFFRLHKDCKDDSKHSRLLEEFQNEYSIDKSLWWYTRDSFVYRMLNKSLRIQNIDILFLFRFFIRDLSQQLKENQWLSPGTVYRGQLLSNDEIKRLEQSTGKLISINSFLSTTLHRDVALIYVDNVQHLEKVLFQIDFNPLIDGIKPFADITFFSDFPQEGEMLFMLGSIFQVENVHYNEEKIWIVQLNLCSDHDQVLKPIFQYLRRESSRCEVDLWAFGNVLHDMGEFEQAKNYYNRCLKLLPLDDYIWKPYCYYLLGLIATKNGKNEYALHLFNKSMVIRTKTLQSSDPSLADTMNAIAHVYYINGNFDRALELFKKALNIFQKAFGEDDLTSAMTYTNMGVACRVLQKYSEALIYHQKALDIRKRHLPSGHFRFGTSYNNMGEVYYGLGQYDIALEYYESACDVYKKSLPSRHIDVAILLINKIMIYEKKDDFQDVLSFYKKAYEICRYMCSEQHPDLIQIKHIIEHAENTKEMHLSIESFGTHWINLLSPFKCIGSLDSRTAHRETHLSYRNIETQSLQKKEN